MNSSLNSSDVIRLKADVYRIVCPVIASICLMALLANLIVLAAVPFRWAMTPTLKLTVSLLISDIWTSLLVGSSLFHNSYFYYVLRVEVSACGALTLEGLRTGGLITGTLHLLALSFNHFLSITQPFQYRKILNDRLVAALIALMWLLPPIAIFIYSASVPGKGFRSEKCMQLEFFHQLPFRLTISLCLVAMFLLMALLYCGVMLKLRQMRKNLTSGGTRAGGTVSSQMRRERAMLFTTLLILATFLIGWLPASLHYILTCSECLLTFEATSLEEVEVTMIISALMIGCIMLKSLLNPVLYAVRIPEIKERFHLFNQYLKGATSASDWSVRHPDRNRAQSEPVIRRTQQQQSPLLNEQTV